MRADIAVIIPTYMRPEKTLRAVRSVMDQAGVRADVIVVDDASPTPFVAPEELLDGHVRVLRLATNGGPAVARNAGVAASAAPVLAFLDSDDFFLPGTLARRLAAFEKLARNARPVLLASAVWRWVPGQSARQFRPVEASTVEAFASGCWYFPGSTSIFSRATWQRVGPLDAGLRRLEDLDWGLRFALARGILRVTPEPAVVIERSARATLAKVSSAAATLLERYGRDGTQPLDGVALARLEAYLALEKASSALGEKHLRGFAANLAASFARRPRLSLHLAHWWSSRAGSYGELKTIEDIARALTR